jgi:Ca2+-binding RTX toxin-like protein
VVISTVVPVIYGGSGNDWMIGTTRADALFAGEGDDSAFGGVGSDRLEDDSGNDELYGGAGNDSMYGGDGDDLMAGGDDADLIVCGGGLDTLLGGAGADVLRAAAGANGGRTFDGGGGGDDTLTCLVNAFDDISLVGITFSGIEHFTWSEFGGATGPRTITMSVAQLIKFGAFEADIQSTLVSTIRLVMQKTTAFVLTDGLVVGLGAEDRLQIRGDGDDESFTGGSGREQISGGGGDDTLIGGGGRDRLAGGLGDDIYASARAPGWQRRPARAATW